MTTDDLLVRTLLIVIVAILLLPVLMMALMMPVMSIWGMGHMWNGGMWDSTGATWMWLLMMFVPLLLLLGGGYLVYNAIRRPNTQQQDAAVAELRTAYARGELSDEEFEERYEQLQKKT